MTVTGTHHGLSVLTAAPPAQRLLRPVAEPVSNCFNDATSGDKYAHSSGHEGIDFECVVGTEVKAMYGGEVIEMSKNNNSLYGLYVKIQSYTNAEHSSGFEHLYAHLNSVSVKCGGIVAKGTVIGLSGDTGTKDPHLHVHLQPFDANGNEPCPWEHDPPRDYNRSNSVISPVATHISGCVNFACFLPPDDALPDIAEHGKLLSARDAHACIPVYWEIVSRDDDDKGTLLSETDLADESNRAGTINGSGIGCYAIQETKELGGSTWHRIQFTTEENGWVPDTGKVGVNRHCPDRKFNEVGPVVWVQVQDSSAPVPPAQEIVPRVSGAGVNVRSAPFIPADSSSNVQGPLTAGASYRVQGTNRAFDCAPLPTTRQYSDAERWWQIDWNGTQGWVRSDVVQEHCVTRRVPLTWPPAPTALKYDLVTPDRLVLGWQAPKVAGITGYQIWSHHVPAPLVIAVHDTGSTEPAWTIYGPLPFRMYYQVATRTAHGVGPLSALLTVVPPAIEAPAPGPILNPTATS